jgi:5-methylcytosine-specific restriction endonuclease McrA
MNPKKLQKLRHQAFIRQDCRCFYCSLPMWEYDLLDFSARYGIRPEKAKHLRCTAEHLIAQQDGGDESSQNIAAACLWCNRMRHARRHDRAPSAEKYKNRVSQLISKQQWHPAAGLYQEGIQRSGHSVSTKCELVASAF